MREGRLTPRPSPGRGQPRVSTPPGQPTSPAGGHRRYGRCGRGGATASRGVRPPRGGTTSTADARLGSQTRARGPVRAGRRGGSIPAAIRIEGEMGSRPGFTRVEGAQHDRQPAARDEPWTCPTARAGEQARRTRVQRDADGPGKGRAAVAAASGLHAAARTAFRSLPRSTGPTAGRGACLRGRHDIGPIRRLEAECEIPPRTDDFPVEQLHRARGLSLVAVAIGMGSRCSTSLGRRQNSDRPSREPGDNAQTGIDTSGVPA